VRQYAARIDGARLTGADSARERPQDQPARLGPTATTAAVRTRGAHRFSRVHSLRPRDASTAQGRRADGLRRFGDRRPERRM